MEQLSCQKMCVTLMLMVAFTGNTVLSNTIPREEQTPVLHMKEESGFMQDFSPLINFRDKLNQSLHLGALASKKQGGLGGLLTSKALGNAVLTLIFDNLEKNIEQRFANLSISDQCKTDLSKTFTGLIAQEQWAIRILDSAGKIGSGVLDGNLYWYGSYDECLKIVPTEMDKNNQTVEAFKTHYLITTIPMPGLPVGLNLGSCFPNSCTAKDVTSIVKEALSPLPIKTTRLKSSVKEETFPLDTAAIVMISILSILLMLLVVATGYDVAVYQPMLEQEREQANSQQDDSGHGSGRASPTEPTEAANAILRADEYTPLLITKKTKAPVNSSDLNIVAKVLLKFSVYSNGQKLLYTGQTSGSVLGSVHGVRFISMSWVILGHTYFFGVTSAPNVERALLGVSLCRNAEKLLSTKQSSSSLSCIHGIRFISLSWVILGHTNFYLLSGPLKNIAVFGDFIKSPSFQAIINATVSVDTFFLLSGLLVTYLLMREMKEKGGPLKINWPLFFFHRFWRLTPAYMLILGSYTALFKYFGNGPAWPGDVPERNCHTHWWTNLLYINNLYKPNSGCMMWTWYLANDMQFYIISPLILIPLYLHFGAGLAVLLVIMLISFITSGVISVQNAYPPSTPAILYHLNMIGDFFKNFYMVPWTRIGPYLIGILVGYALYRTNRKVTLQWYTVTLGWILAAGVNLTILYGLYDVANGSLIDPSVSALYNTVHRTLWAAGVGWVIFACVTGYGGPVNSLLSWPALVPLSRLTYVAYLMHPIIMEWFYMSSKTPIYLDISNVIYLFLAHMVMSYGVSFVLSLAFEAPLMALEKLIFKRT